MYPLGDQQVPGEEVEFEVERENFNTYILHDGTKPSDPAWQHPESPKPRQPARNRLSGVPAEPSSSVRGLNRARNAELAWDKTCWAVFKDATSGPDHALTKCSLRVRYVNFP